MQTNVHTPNSINHTYTRGRVAEQTPNRVANAECTVKTPKTIYAIKATTVRKAISTRPDENFSILTWRGNETWSPKPLIIERGFLAPSNASYAAFVTGYA